MHRLFGFRRGFSSLSAIQYAKNGIPKEVLEITALPALGKPTTNQVKIKMLAAPVNPSDINMVEGTYNIKTTLPACAGNEGVGIVKEIGDNVQGIQVGDWVIPVGAGLGTWRQELITDTSRVTKIANDIPIPYAATIAVNPCTAYRLLNDFAYLNEGDYIIQNGANSMVGLAIIQMARERGIKTINVIRSDRPDVDKVTRLLTNLGGDINITDAYLNSYGFQEILRDIAPIKLGLNCVGGECGTDIARSLGHSGVMVTYGGMSKRPLKIPFDLITYKQLVFTGFNIYNWNSSHTEKDRRPMIDYICELIRQEKLSLFYEMHDLDDFHHALHVSSESFNFRKIILNLDYPDRFAEHDKKTADDYWHFEAPVV